MTQYNQFPYPNKSVEIESGMNENIQTHGELLDNWTRYYNIENIDKFDQSYFISKQRELIKNQIHIWGENIRSLYQLGDIHILKHNYSKASDIYNKIIKMDSKFLPAYEKLILVYILLKNIELANNSYQKLLNVSNRRHDFLHNYIIFRIAFFNKNQEVITQCIQDSIEIMKNEPKNYRVINTYGLLLLNFKSNIAKAKQHFKMVLSIDSNYIHSINNLGVCYLRENNNQKALKYFEKALQINKFYSSAYENIASVFIKEQKNKNALDILEKGYINKINFSDMWWQNYVWLKLENGFYKFAEVEYLKLIKKNPKNNFLYNNLGVSYLKQGERRKAIKYFLEAIDIYHKYHINKPIQDTRSLLPFYNMGRMAIDDGHADIVEKISNYILKLKNNDGFGKYLKGKSLMMKGQFKISKNYFEEILKKEPYIPDIYPDLSFIYVSITHEYSNAIKLLKKAIKLKIKNTQIFNNLAYAYIKHGDEKKAKEILDKFILDPPPVILATKGLYFLSIGILDEGIKYYKQSYINFGKHQENKELVMQNSLYEQALYWFKRKKFEKSRKLVNEAKIIRKSYLSEDIDNLETVLKSKN